MTQNDGSDEFKNLLVLDTASDKAKEYFMINRRKVFADVTFEHISLLSIVMAGFSEKCP